VILGPGALAPANVGVLEGVQDRRLRYGWGLDEAAGPDTLLMAVEDCDYIGYDGLVIVKDELPRKARVVDCQRRDELPRLAELGIVADINTPELGHRQAVIVLWH